jgi:ribosomal protein S18 acetylase RimI-like enzyme
VPGSSSPATDAPVRVRRATPADATSIARHRARMFEEMGQLPDEHYELLHSAAETYLADAIGRGEYVGWLAAPADDPARIVAGAGAQRRRVLPHPVTGADGRVRIAEGRHAVVLNVYTDPDWRRRGLGGLLMREVLAWARAERLDRLVLHASDAGRPLYERLGFAATNEMRFAGALW